jgi:hypothetical protein
VKGNGCRSTEEREKKEGYKKWEIEGQRVIKTGWESEREGVRKIQRNSAERRRDVNVHRNRSGESQRKRWRTVEGI